MYFVTIGEVNIPFTFKLLTVIDILELNWEIESCGTSENIKNISLTPPLHL